jgi:monofunctional biosynthetic peptidoglycan transglycosylase
VLKLLELRRFTLVGLLIAAILMILSGLSALLLWFSTDVEKLISQYPVYNLETKRYEFQINRPSHWTEVNKVSNYAKWAIIVSEDWAFFDHQGVDFNQLKIVIDESIEQQKFIRGASTITQQIIKNTVLYSEKTLWRKFREMILAYKLEMYLSKEKILEIYLNIIELGENIYGIKSASHFYFNKNPKFLTAREGAFLAMLLPSPVKHMSSFKKKELTPFAKNVVDSILIKLRQADVYDEQTRLLEAQKLFYWEQRDLGDELDYYYE